VDIVSVFRSRPALRWLVPSAAAVVIIGGGAAAGTIVASADPSLPDRSAAQLLVDVQSAKVDGFSGTVVETADLGLPAIAGAVGSAAPSGNITRLLSGSNTARVWYAGENQARLALVGTDGETDVIRDGTDAWLWSSADNSATHVTLPAGAPDKAMPGNLPVTPQEAADQALASISPTTKVTTTGAAKVAGRDAYELVLSPKDTTSLVGQVRLAIDAEHHIPLRVDVYAKNATNPAVRVAFQQISFTKPDAQEFKFNPPPGAKVNESSAQGLEQQHQKATQGEKAKLGDRAKLGDKAKGPQPAAEPKIVGKGWTSILSLKMPAASGSAAPAAKGKGDAAQLQNALNILPSVSGSWGKGHLLSGALFSALITDDGRVFVGAVTPEALYQAAAK
jgi:outer membrane lipoprotein-sorting protein